MKMEKSNLAYFELYSLAEEANKEIKNLKENLQQLPSSLNGISDKIFDRHRKPDMDYEKLADEVRAAAVELAEWKRRWDELAFQIDDIQFRMFLAEGHALVHTHDRKKKKEKYSKWHGRYKHSYKD